MTALDRRGSSAQRGYGSRWQKARAAYLAAHPLCCRCHEGGTITAATVVYFSVQGFHLFLHAILITFFVALTAPVTTIFLMRAALFRERQHGNPKVPPPSGLPQTKSSLPS